MLALDWAKAFDRVCPARLLDSLRRFGVPEGFVRVIEATFQGRKFYVKAEASISAWHSQDTGIIQGCPLSPFLFSILMTCLLHDADARVTARHGPPQNAAIASRSLLYADDTLLMEVDADTLQSYMEAIEDIGALYGLQLNQDKLEVLSVDHDGILLNRTGEPIKRKPSIVYLGSLLTSDGRITSELSRRVGLAEKTFRDLARVWKHADLPVGRKRRIYDACVLSKLLYGLHTAWLNEAERKRLDAFHCQCLRRIHGVAPAYISRTPNRAVLEMAGSRPLRYTLLRQQLAMFGHVARLPDSNLVRQAVFQPSSARPRAGTQPRRVGRPRLEWCTEVHRHASRAAETEGPLLEMMQDRARWRPIIDQYVSHCIF